MPLSIALVSLAVVYVFPRSVDLRGGLTGDCQAGMYDPLRAAAVARKLCR